jgi:hypothetical protein
MRSKLIVSIFLLTFLSLSIVAQVKSNDKTVKIDFCELLNNPERYIGKIVQTKATYTAGMESAWLSQNCSQKDSKSRLLNVEFDNKWRNNSSPKSILKFEKSLEFKNDKLGEQRSVNISFIGIFRSIKSKEDDVLPIYKVEILFLK